MNAMNELNFEERNLASIFNGGGTREGQIAVLREMRGHLEPEDAEALALTGSTIAKLEAMTDAEFAALDLSPDYDPEDAEDAE